ncbi:MAG TPA: GAF domain-containing protein, partial [Thermosynechococcaceae cyanobacterium]
MNEALKILLVDDDAVDRMAVCRSLKRAEVQVDIAEVETCAAAIALLQQQAFDCVLLDYCLPDGNGLTLVQQIRSAGIRTAPIVLTDHGDEQVAVEIMKAGAYDYLSKNKLTPETLTRSLSNAVRIHRAEVQAAEANQKLKESEERYRLVLEGSNDGVWDWYICLNEIYCNDRLFEILGIVREEFGTAYDAFYRLIHPDDRLRVLRAITAHLEQGENFDVEFRLLHSSGDYRYCTSRGKAQRNERGNLFRMSGIITDISDRKRTEAKITALNRALERRVTELQTLFDVIPIGITIADDPNCQQVRINATYAETLSIPVDANASLTVPLGERQPHRAFRDGLELQPAELPMEKAIAQGEKLLGYEVDYLLPSGKLVNMVGYTTPLFDEQGQTRGCLGAFVDITDRKREESAQRFLAEASSLLTISLDATAILRRLAELSVTFLADCCCFDLIDREGNLRRVVWQHRDPAQADWFSQIQRYVPTIESNHPIAACLTTGLSVLVSEVSQDWLQSTLAELPEHLQFAQDLGLTSLMTVPLKVYDRCLGTLTFCRTNADQPYTQADLRLAEDLAQRTALAVDNAQLYRSTQEAEQNLRQALIILGQHQQQLRTLQRLTDLLNQRLTNLPELLRVMVEAIREAIPQAEFGVMVLQNPYTGLLEMSTATGLQPDQLHLTPPFQPGEGVLGEIFLAGPRLLQAEEMAALNDRALPLALCGVAIESAPGGGRLGVLAIGNWRNPLAFTEDDLHLLSAFGEQAAIALTNAQLIRALGEREERLEVQNRILGEQNRELERQRYQIQLQNLKLREAAQIKSQFIATMSHELRTPMNAVIGFSQLLLRQDKLEQPQADMVQRILNNGKNLLALINDILDLSKIEAGRLELRLEKVNLATLIAATVSELRSISDQKNLAVHIELKLDDPYVFNDSTRLRQVLINLLSNAIKFTETGSVRVVAEAVSSTTVALIVQDTGIGIAEASLGHIFEEFHQVDQTLSKKFAGTGLGLTITDLLVRLMNGRI